MDSRRNITPRIIRSTSFGPVITPDGSKDLYDAVASKSIVGIDYWLNVVNVPVNTNFFQKGTAMHAAAQLDDPTFSKYLFERGGSLDTYNDRHETPLITALRLKKTHNARFYIQAGSPLDATDRISRTALLIACKLALYEIASMLIYRGANVNLGDFLGTPLHNAVFNGHMDLIRLLVERGADLDAEDLCFHRTPLCMSVFQGRYDIARFLVNQGANIEHVDRFNLVPLHLAAIGGHPEMITLLLNRGANIHAQDSLGNTPLHKAGQYEEADCFALLIRKGAIHSRRNALGMKCRMGAPVCGQDRISDYHC